MMSTRKFTPKNKLTLLALSLIVPAAMAGTMGEISTSPFESLYGGIMGGVLETNSRISATGNSNYSELAGLGDNLATTQSHVNVNNFSGTGAIYLGYGRFISSSLFIAAEIAGNVGNRKNTLNNLAPYQNPNGSIYTASLATSTTAKLHSGEFDFDIRPGFLMDTNTMLYGRVGGALNQLTLTSNNTFIFNQPAYIGLNITAATYTSPLNQYKSRNVVGLRLGAGIERAVRQSFSITADYIYTYYGTINTSNIGNSTSTAVGVNSAFTNVNGLSGNSSARIFTQAAMLGVKYYFPVRSWI